MLTTTEHHLRLRAPEDAIDTTAALEWVKVEAIMIDPSYQRELTHPAVETIKREFDPLIFGVVQISRRANGSLWATDGQHRLAALRELGYGERRVPAIVHEELSVEEEAEQFYKPQTTRRVLFPAERLRAQLKAKDPHALDLVRTVERAGFRLNMERGSTKDPLSIDAVGSVERIRRHFAGDILEQTLQTSYEAWQEEGLKIEGTVLRGLAVFLARYSSHPRYDPARLIEILRGGAPNRLDASGRELSLSFGGRREDGIGRAIQLRYNNHLSFARRLPMWDEMSGRRGAKPKRFKRDEAAPLPLTTD